MDIPTRAVRPDELIVPGQSLALILEASIPAINRIMAGVGAMRGLYQVFVRALPGRVGIAYSPLLPVQAESVIQTIETAREGEAVSFALLTVDWGELAEDAQQLAMNAIVEGWSFVPRTTGRVLGTPVGRLLTSGPMGTLLAVGGVLLVGGIIVYAVQRKG